jgi:hypothetical protein
MAPNYLYLAGVVMILIGTLTPQRCMIPRPPLRCGSNCPLVFQPVVVSVRSRFTPSSISSYTEEILVAMILKLTPILLSPLCLSQTGIALTPKEFPPIEALPPLPLLVRVSERLKSI